MRPRIVVPTRIGERLAEDVPAVAIETSVTWGDCDPAGVVFYPRIFAWMDRAAHSLFRRIGIPPEDELPPSTQAFPVVEASGEFLAPMRLDEALEVSVAVLHVGRTSFRLGYEIRRLPNREIVARGWEQRVRVELGSSGRLAPRALDPAQRLSLQALEAPAVSEATVGRGHKALDDR